MSNWNVGLPFVSAVGGNNFCLTPCKLATIALCGWLLLPGLASASMLASDGFEADTLGALSGQGGGTGWGASWGTSTANVVDTTSNPLSYVVIGGATNNGQTRALEVISTSTQISARQLATPLTNTFYVGYLVRYQSGGGIAGNNTFTLFLSTSASSTTAVNFGLKQSSPNSFVLRNGTAAGGSFAGGALVTGTTYYLVVRMNWGGSAFTSADLWVNPDYNDLTPDTTLSGISQSAVTHVFFRHALLDADDVLRADEIKIGTAWSDVVPPSGPVNPPPSVTLTNPVNNASFLAPASILLEATATDSNGTVTNVAFYAGATKLADDPTAPFSLNWTGVSAGSYALTVVATDNQGALTTSAVVNVTVTNSLSVALTNPVNAASFLAPANLLLEATAADSNGTVTNVAFYAGAIKLADDPTAPFSFNWTGVSAGSYALTAVATDNQGASTTSATVNISVIDTNSANVQKWHPVDISFSSTTAYANPFTDVTLSAVFTGPGGTNLTVPGFYTKSNTWIVRFSPTAEGSWNYLTTSTDSQLSNKSGAITCVANLNTNVHGAIQIDPGNPRHFKYEDGTRYFLLGYEIGWLGMMDTNATKAKTLIDIIVTNGFNSVDMALFAYDTPWRTGLTTTDGLDPQGNSWDFGINTEFPWEYSGSKTPASSKFNQAFWASFDKVIDYLFQKGVTAQIYLRMQPNKYLSGMYPSYQTAQENLLFKYAIARYQAYPNVVWDFEKELNSRASISVTSERLQFIKSQDGYKRLRTVHDADPFSQDTTANKNLDLYTDQNHSSWYDVVITQRGYLSCPIVNAEYCYQVGNDGGITYSGGTPSAAECLQRTCELVMAGGYATYNYTYAAWDVIRWNEKPNDLDRYLNLVNFFKTTKWYTLSPGDTLIGGGVQGKHCLANPGNEYIVYLNGTGSATLTISGAASGTPLTVKWVDLNTGVSQAAANVGNGTTTFTKPSGMSSSPTMLYIAPPAVPPVATVQVETAADGSGTAVPTQSFWIPPGGSVTGYAITRDVGGNFIANVAPDAWLLQNITGNIVSGDLFVAGDSKSATFSALHGGTANLRATLGGFLSSPIPITVLNTNLSDTTPPSVSITPPTNGASLFANLPVTVSATVTDNVAVASVELWVDGSLQPPVKTIAPFDFLVTNLTLGGHTIAVTGQDTSANRATNSVSVTLVAPEAPPLVLVPSGGLIQLSWSEPGFGLEQATAASGPWANLAPPPASPFTIIPTNSESYFRLKWTAP